MIAKRNSDSGLSTVDKGVFISRWRRYVYHTRMWCVGQLWKWRCAHIVDVNMTHVTLTSMTLVRSSTRHCSTTQSVSARRLLVPDARVPAVRSLYVLGLDSASQSLYAGPTTSLWEYTLRLSWKTLWQSTVAMIALRINRWKQKFIVSVSVQSRILFHIVCTVSSRSGNHTCDLWIAN